MDVEFMLSDTFEQLRPKLELYKTFGEAAQAVDEMLAAVAISGELSSTVLLPTNLLIPWSFLFPGPIEEEIEEVMGDAQEGPRAGATDGADEAEEGDAEATDSEEEESDVSFPHFRSRKQDTPLIHPSLVRRGRG